LGGDWKGGLAKSTEYLYYEGEIEPEAAGLKVVGLRFRPSPVVIVKVIN